MIRTEDLTPRQINMLVAVAEGWVPPSDPLVHEYKRRRREDGSRLWRGLFWLDNRDLTEAVWAREPHNYCEVDAFAGPIIDRKRISTIYIPGPNCWGAGYDHSAKLGFNGQMSVGASRLEAAMRAYVRKVYGDEIDTTDKPWLLEAAAS